MEGYIPRGCSVPLHTSASPTAIANGIGSKAEEAPVASTVSNTIEATAGKAAAAATGHRTPAGEADAAQPHAESNDKTPNGSFAKTQSSNAATSTQQAIGAPASGREGPDSARVSGPFLASSCRQSGSEHDSVLRQEVQAESDAAADEPAPYITPVMDNAADVSTPQQPVLVGASVSIRLVWCFVEWRF